MINPLTFAVLGLSSLLFACGGAGGDDTGSASGTGSMPGATGGSDNAGSGGNTGTDPRLSCDAYAPCGGSVVGRWRMAATCTKSWAGTPECQNNVSSTVVSGDAVWVFGSDGMANVTGSYTMTTDVSVSDACAESLNFTDSSAYCDWLQTPNPDRDVPSEADCTRNTGHCDCHVKSGPIEDSGAAEAYQTTESELALGDTSFSYCVKGDTLTLGVDAVPYMAFIRE